MGHALFGLSPFAPGADWPARPDLRPVLRRVSTAIIHVAEHGQGSDIALDRAFAIPRARRVAVLPVGLGHGVSRPRPDAGAAVIVAGAKVPVLGVSLEHTTLELPLDSPTLPGDAATLIGGEGDARIDLDQYARWRGLSPLEALMQLAPERH